MACLEMAEWRNSSLSYRKGPELLLPLGHRQGKAETFAHAKLWRLLMLLAAKRRQVDVI